MSELFNNNRPFSTGIAELDAEHAQLHIEAKRVAAKIASHGDADTVQASVKAFIELLDAHFQHEETLFNRLTVARAEQHRKEHAMILLSLRLFSDVVKDREGVENWNDFINLEDVLLKHIILYDLDFRA